MNLNLNNKSKYVEISREKIEIIKEKGTFKTKRLEGILVHIAL